MIKRLFRYLETISPGILIVGCYVYSTVICYLDYLTGDYSLSLLYILSSITSAWFVGIYSGIGVSCFNWSAMAFVSWLQHGHSLLHYWNHSIELFIMLLLCFLIKELRHLYNKEQKQARYDELSGLYNRRCFFKLSEQEIARASRYHHPLTLVYIDIDNFKTINDTQGHQEGDRVISAVGRVLKEKLRATDIAARLGGDEFAVLFTESDFDDANGALNKVQNELLLEMQKYTWPVTFSIGAITTVNAIPNLDILLAKADGLMYEIKNNGKAGLRHQTT
jgi:diguanylate cyclase (GGDEF)-like protein